MIAKYALAGVVPVGALLVMYVVDRQQLKSEFAAELERVRLQQSKEVLQSPRSNEPVHERPTALEERHHAMEARVVEPESEAEPAFSTEDVRTNLQVVFDAQPRSPVAAAAVRSNVVDALGKAAWPSQIIQKLDCGATICRVQTASLKAEEGKDYVARLTDGKNGWRGPVAIFPQEESDGSVTIEAYLGAQGTELPLPE